jgi:hypothetical protein
MKPHITTIHFHNNSRQNYISQKQALQYYGPQSHLHIHDADATSIQERICQKKIGGRSKVAADSPGCNNGPSCITTGNHVNTHKLFAKTQTSKNARLHTEDAADDFGDEEAKGKLDITNAIMSIAAPSFLV